MTNPCPLCHHPNPRPFFSDANRAYRWCPVCALIFTVREDLLAPKDEKARYDLHENNPQDLHYRRFLSQFLEPLVERIGPPPLKGLDFGSGPGPTLSVMLEDMGYEMHLYDSYYARKPDALLQTYDFVTCTETIEHFYSPGKEWERLLKLVRPGGWLGFMTRLIDDPSAFPQWYYKNDDTHVSFFSRQTFHYLADRDGLSLEFIADNVILLQKPDERLRHHHINADGIEEVGHVQP
jgi:hypothetical protein